jgi:hypothetical protein
MSTVCHSVMQIRLRDRVGAALADIHVQEGRSTHIRREALEQILTHMMAFLKSIDYVLHRYLLERGHACLGALCDASVPSKGV